MAYIATASGITAVIDGENYTITSDNPSYQQVLEAIGNREAPENIAELFRTANAIKRYAKGLIEVRDGVLYYEGEEIHNVVVDRILAFMAAHLPVEPLIAFLGRLMANPSRRSIEELYTFLEHKALPITEDGCFLAYKGVRDNYLDCHTGTFDNHPGTINEMPRQKVDDDFRRGCSYGFHVGSLEYATGFGSRTVIVKVDPADVVSVPSDCSCQKLRTAKYEVICDYKGAMTDPLANSRRPYGG
jgi:hypothetical protein